MFKIKWIGQSGYILYDENTTIYIDPYLSDCVNRAEGRVRMVSSPVLPEEVKADAYICTHNHLDHLDVDLIDQIDKDENTLYAPSDCKETLLSLGVKKYIPFDCGTKATVGDFEIEAVYALHTSPAIGVVISHDETVLYFTGDTFYCKELEGVKCDILFVCINGKLGNMDVYDAIRLTKAIQPKLGIPNHYGMFESNNEDPRKYTDKLSNGYILELNREYIIDKGSLK